MIKNYIIIALRSIRRNKVFSFINIFGLAIGVACCLLLSLYIQDEMSYDRHHKDLNSLYRVTTRFEKTDGLNEMSTTSAPIVWGVKDEVPQIETVTRLVNPPGVSQNLIRYEDKQFYESDGYIADSTLFDIFTYEFLSGDPKKALVEANSVVITEDLARKLFGTAQALDKVIFISQGGPSANFRITGVLKDTPAKSHIHANFFVSMTSDGWAQYLRSENVADEWGGQNFLLSYIKLKPGADPKETIAGINKVFLKYGAEDMKALGMKKSLGLEALKDIHLYAHGRGQSARITYIYVVASIAAFILLIACINFMNLSTAKATKRASEVGLRKTLGAQRSTLIRQFLGEAMLIVVLAIVVSMVIVQVILPYFNLLTEKNITLHTENLVRFGLTIAGIALVTGVIVGSYPAFYLSSFQPAKVLKGKITLQASNALLRRSLVVFQFVIAIVLVCGMLIITKQLRFMQNKDLGFSSGSRIVIPIRTETAGQNHRVLENELRQLSSVEKVSSADYLPGGHIFGDGTIYPKGGSMDNGILVHRNTVEPNFMDIMNIKLLAGRNFDPTGADSTGDELRIIINQTAVKKFGFTPETAVGQELYTDWHGERRTYQVIGVMADFNQVSPKEPIYPILLWLTDNPNELANIVIKTKDTDFQRTIADIETVWKKVNPDTPFEFTFLDDSIKKQYDEDRRISGVITSFSLIAMIISCLGLYGLSTYMAERRFKEIGVRKVLGASVSQIVQMMSGEFVKLVVIAFVLSVPLSWYGITSWLETFDYKTPLGVSVFIIAGVSALIIALLTVSFESVKAASGNPVNALRNE